MSESHSRKISRRPRWVQNYLVEERRSEQPARTGYFVTAAMLFVLGSTTFFLVLNGVLGHQGLALLDEPVRAWMVEHRTEGWTTVMIVIAEISGPVGMPIIVAVAIGLWVWRSGHAWRVLVLGLAMVTGMSLALLIAPIVGRSRPPEEFMMIGVDPSFSFPSGHVLGAADFLIVGGYLVVSRGRGWGVAALAGLIAIVGIGLVALTRVYLGYHWLTDMAASLSLSLCVVGLAIAFDTWRPLQTDPPPDTPGPVPLSSGTDRV